MYAVDIQFLNDLTNFSSVLQAAHKLHEQSY
jgi:hypothetical protein